ncbi:polysaccharide pyruvyl transferase family protein [Propionibacteriaceae bacterium Y2011]
MDTSRRSERRPIRRVQAVGAYGFGNFGDQLFVETVQRHAATLWPNATVRTFAPAGRSRLYASSRWYGQAARLGAAAVGLAWADTIAVCGGSVLQDVGGVARLRQRALRGQRVEALGVSVGPFNGTGAAQRVESFLAHVDRLVVRDPASVQRLEQLSHTTTPVVGGDLVALNGLVQPETERSDTIVICPSAAAQSDLELLTRQAGDAVDEVNRSEPHRVTVLAMSSQGTSDDGPLCAGLASGLSDRGIDVDLASFADLGLSQTCRLLASSAMVWSQRLHGAIVAYLSDVPFMLVGHHAKCRDFGSDIGADQQIVALDEPWAPVAAALADGSFRPHMGSDAYRDRARGAYAAASAD